MFSVRIIILDLLCFPNVMLSSYFMIVHQIQILNQIYKETKNIEEMNIIIEWRNVLMTKKSKNFYKIALKIFLQTEEYIMPY